MCMILVSNGKIMTSNMCTPDSVYLCLTRIGSNSNSNGSCSFTYGKRKVEFGKTYWIIYKICISMIIHEL